MSRTLALHLGALGDFVLSWPALGLLAAHGELELWGRPEWGRLILPPRRVHDREAARYASLFADRPDPALEEWLAAFARAVVFAASPPPELMRNLEIVVPTVWSVATRPQPGAWVHAGDMQVEQLRGLGLSGAAAPPAPRLERPVEPLGAILAPGSGGQAKRLNPELTARLARRMAAEHERLTLLLGPAEDPDYARALAQALAEVPHQVLRSPPMPELAALLAGASLYLGADSGVTHLAAALGAPCLAVFSLTNPKVWAPRGPRVRIMNSHEAPYASLVPPDRELC